MDNSTTTFRKAFEYLLPWLVLAVLITYTYARFYEHPYGIRWQKDATVERIFVKEPEPTIHKGDKLVKVGSVDFGQFLADLRQELFAGTKPGEVVPVVLERGGRTLRVSWKVPGQNAGEVQDQLFNPWFISYFFWIAGTMTVLMLRPRDSRWLLLAGFDFLTAIWLTVGSGLSGFHIWYSALVLRTAIWIWLPVTLHLHWVFPRPLGRLSPALIWSAYVITTALAVAQWLQLLGQSLYLVAFLVAIVGSLILLALHAARQPDMRRDLSLLLIAAAIAIVPSIILAIAALTGPFTPPTYALALLSLPVLPFAYMYAAYRRQLGGLEMRVNNAIAIYTFIILLGAVIVPALLVVHRLLPTTSVDRALIVGVVGSIGAAALSLWGYPHFQRFFERRVLGIAVPSKELQQAYSTAITTSNSFAELTHLLDNEILPTLLVRQFAFLLMESGSAGVLLSRGVDREQIPVQNAGEMLKALSSSDAAETVKGTPYAWIRLALPLRTQDELVGIWLFGRRDPDDLYSSVEQPMLQLFANQTAVAVSNILQSDRLRAMYQANINRHENERLSLARDLHDSVLSELAGMLMNADMQTLPKSFQDGYRELTRRLREIVNELRPPMLSYGLKPAIEELADNLMERTKDAVEIEVDLASDGDRYPIDREQHLFRMVQEACENAVRHSGCRAITISGSLAPTAVDMTIRDDGNGFRMAQDTAQLYALVSDRHFGLAGMFERAEVIDADIHIVSAPGEGTSISIRWKWDPAAPQSDQGSDGSSS